MLAQGWIEDGEQGRVGCGDAFAGEPLRAGSRPIIDDMDELNERDLQRDGRNITLLQESLQRSTGLCHEMLKHLDNFENRVAALEPTVLPLGRNLAIISRVNKSCLLLLWRCRWLILKM